ncbi:hypothetical protein KDAU_13290 [Dictyobacter aurantiacus]|uniref:Uncharacterized protein n=1 Tax=Dictyobacter aurantiacus TaxID=1936993 RepID=A0A401ZAU7_9CHLR|nr:hypothetical protein KDAU_13290 [Dictyobacter aurantiacus]
MCFGVLLRLLAQGSLGVFGWQVYLDLHHPPGRCIYHAHLLFLDQSPLLEYIVLIIYDCS